LTFQNKFFMKILVTGGNGFLGHHLVKRLLEQGHEVSTFDWEKRPHERLASLDFNRIQGDITDRKAVLEAVREVEVVFHTAGDVSLWRKGDAAQTKVNVEGARNVVEACLRHKVQRLIHASSIAAVAVDPSGGEVDEDWPFNWEPYQVNYCLSKHLAELEVQKGMQAGLDAVIVNPGIFFGPGLVTSFSYNTNIVVLGAQKKLTRYPIGGICVCDVEDVALGHILAWEKGRSGQRYILGGHNLSWKEIFFLVTDVVGQDPPKRLARPWEIKILVWWSELMSHFTHTVPFITREMAVFFNLRFHCSSQKAVRESGYQITPFRQTLEKTYQWYLNNQTFPLSKSRGKVSIS
jgi:dihydroflavonol-4-reductase